MAGTHTAAEIPGIADILINGEIYMFDTSYDDSPFRKPPAAYGYTPTFLERTNVSGNYGDDSQAFFLTESQNDWSLGEMRRYFRPNDPDGIRRYYTGTNIDPTSVPGQIILTRTTPSLTFAGAVRAVCSHPTAIYAGGTTNLYHVVAAGTITDDGAHGLGVAPAQWGLTSDSVNVFLSSTAGGTVGVRKWNGAAFSTFSATGADSLAFLNNVLYGYQDSTGRLIQYSTAGVASTIFTWQDGVGAALTGSGYASRLRPYGGLLYILRKQGAGGPAELWQYDGTSTFELAGFPANFVAAEMDVVSGICLISGYITRGNDILPSIYYYINGQVDRWWQANTLGYTNTTWPALAAYGEGVTFTDDTTGNLMQGNIGVGGVHTIGTYTVTNATPLMAANKDVLLHTRNSVTAYYSPSSTTNTTGTMVSSLFDFDNSLLKLPRGIKVEFDAGTDGNGGSVDIAYQFDATTGAFVNLQTGAVSGTEYALPATPCHGICVRVTLNKGTSTRGPTFKRTFVSASPYLTAFRSSTYLLDLSGNKNASNPGYLKLVNQTTHTKDGDEMRADLVTAILAGPVSITDRFGTFTGIVEPGGTLFREVKSVDGRAEYRGEIAVRQIQ